MTTPITFIAAIKQSPTAIKIDGEEDAGGEITYTVSGDNVAALLLQTAMRGKLLKITVEEEE